MQFLRKVGNNIIILLGLALMLGTSSCTQDSLKSTLPQVLKEIADNQECCYMEYKVKGSIEGRANRISRESAVKIHVKGAVGTYRGTGTYFDYKGSHIVITAAHLWAEYPPTALKSEALVTGPSEKVVGKLVYWDPYVDIAIMVVPKMESRSPAKFVRDPNYAVGQSVIYSGFPGANSLLTFRGEVAGDGYGTSIAINSFAWGGSSGSGVFDERGRYVGVVSAIMVGRGFIGPQLVGSVVYVAPANLIDMQLVRQNIRLLGERKNDGF
jgi:S1-C subfamily serine protease